MTVAILIGDAIAKFREMPANSVHCVVTSVPYWGLRQYIVDGAPEKPFEIGLEPTPEEWAARLVEVFREVRRVLRPDGVCFVNVGDGYNSGSQFNGHKRKDGSCALTERNRYEERQQGVWPGARPHIRSLKHKDLIGQPWLLAFALRADGWYLRSEIIWSKCLSGGAWLYARTQKGDMPVMIKDLVRLDPATVKLWNGEKWTQAVGWSRTQRPDDPIEIELGSGERVGCTPEHKWPTERGLVRADELRLGDTIRMARLPEPDQPLTPALVPDEIGWLVGIYLAEGSRSKDGDCIQFASHVNEAHRFERLKLIAASYGGTCNVHQTSENGCTANIYSRVIGGLLQEYIGGSDAYTKCLSTKAWQRSNGFLAAVLDGYLEGDAHKDPENDRWILGFTRNEALARDMRTICARLGYRIKLRPRWAQFDGRSFATWRGEIRKDWPTHHNARKMGEVVAIGRSRARSFWMISVEDEPHLFSLASGVLTKNSNPMPESVRDRPTKAHEQVFLLTKSASYYYDQEAIRENGTNRAPGNVSHKGMTAYANGDEYHRTKVGLMDIEASASRNARSVWTIATEPFSESHFAVMPSELARRCILAGTSAKGCCPACAAPWARVVERVDLGWDSSKYGERAHAAAAHAGGIKISAAHSTLGSGNGKLTGKSETLGWSPTCACDAGEPIPCTVLDCFAGAGTTGLVAEQLGRNAILIELNPQYAEMARRRIDHARARRAIGDVAERPAVLPGQGELAL